MMMVTSWSSAVSQVERRDRVCSETETAMWERTLQDLVRGLRANKKDEGKFIAQVVDEIRKEIKGKDMELKAGAVLKLTYVRRR